MSITVFAISEHFRQSFAPVQKTARMPRKFRCFMHTSKPWKGIWKMKSNAWRNCARHATVANHESLALRRDRKHLIAELRFLRHMAEEEEGLILVLQNSNQYLEASRGTLEASSAALAKISAEAQCKSLDWLTRLTPPRIRCLIPVVPLVSGEIWDQCPLVHISEEILRDFLVTHALSNFSLPVSWSISGSPMPAKIMVVDGEYYSIGMGLCSENSCTPQTKMAIAHDYYQLRLRFQCFFYGNPAFS